MGALEDFITEMAAKQTEEANKAVSADPVAKRAKTVVRQPKYHAPIPEVTPVDDFQNKFNSSSAKQEEENNKAVAGLLTPKAPYVSKPALPVGEPTGPKAQEDLKVLKKSAGSFSEKASDLGKNIKGGLFALDNYFKSTPEYEASKNDPGMGPVAVGFRTSLKQTASQIPDTGIIIGDALTDLDQRYDLGIWDYASPGNQPIRDILRESSEYWNDIVRKEVENKEDFSEGEKFASEVSSGFTSVATYIVASKLFGGKAPYILAAGERSAVYNEALEETGSRDKARQAYVNAVLVSGTIDKIGTDFLLSKMPGSKWVNKTVTNFLKKIPAGKIISKVLEKAVVSVLKGTAEGVQETFQDFSVDVIRNHFFGGEFPAFEEYVRTFQVSFVVGQGASIAVDFTNDPTAMGAKEELVKKGFTEKEAEEFITAYAKSRTEDAGKMAEELGKSVIRENRLPGMEGAPGGLPQTTLSSPSAKQFNTYNKKASSVEFKDVNDMKLILDRTNGEVIGVQNRDGDKQMLPRKMTKIDKPYRGTETAEATKARMVEESAKKNASLEVMQGQVEGFSKENLSSLNRISQKLQGKTIQNGDVDTAKNMLGEELDEAIEMIREVVDPNMSEEAAFNMLKDKVLPGVKEIQSLKKEIKLEDRDAISETTKRKTLPKSEKIELTARDYVKNITKAQAKSSKESISNVKDMQKKLIKMSQELLPKTFQAGLTNRITDVSDQKKYDKMVDVIMERASKAKDKLEKEVKGDLTAKIKKAIKATKTKVKNGTEKGKYTAEIQKPMDVIRKALAIDPGQYAQKVAENIEKYGMQMPLEAALENRVLTLMDQGINGMQKVLDSIKELKENGMFARALKDFNLQTEFQRSSEHLIDRVLEKGTEGLSPAEASKKLAPSKALKQKLKTMGHRWILSWPGLMSVSDQNNSVEDQVLKEKFSVLKQENEYKERSTRNLNAFYTALSESYDIGYDPGSVQSIMELNRKISSLNEIVEIGDVKDADGKMANMDMSRDQLIKRWMEIQDPTLKESFIEGNRYSPEIFTAIEDAIQKNPGDKDFANAQFEIYRNNYKEFNEVFGKMNGVDLSFSEFYSPIRRKGVKETGSPQDTMLNNVVARMRATASAGKARTGTLKAIDEVPSVMALNRNLNETNRYTTWAEKVRELDTIFNTPGVKDAYVQSFGRELHDTVNWWIKGFSGKNTPDIHRAVDWFRKKHALGTLMLKPAIAVKQLVSTVAYAEKISSVQLMKGIVDFLANPISNLKTLNSESTFIRERGKNMERDLRAAMDLDSTKRFLLSHQLADLAMTNIKLGDKGAILLGSWALRKIRLEQGVPLEDIIKEYEEFGSETQQSSDFSRLAPIQSGGSLAKIFTMYKSSQRQYLEKELSAIRSIFQEGGTSAKNMKKVAKTVFIYHVVLPVLFQFIANAGGTDDEDKEEYLRAGILGSINGLFIAGDAINTVVTASMNFLGPKIDEEYSALKQFDSEIPIYDMPNDVAKLLKNLGKDDIEAVDVLDAISDLGADVGLPTEYPFNFAQGIKAILEEDYDYGLGLIGGWSEYKLKGMKEESSESETTNWKNPSTSSSSNKWK